jgi:glucose/arabinose dehydrogenase
MAMSVRSARPFSAHFSSGVPSKGATDAEAFDAVLNDVKSFAEPSVRVLESRRFPELGVEVQVLAQNLKIPWDLQFAPDGKLYFTERSGNVRVIENGVVRREPVLTVPVGRGEGGLLGMALDPDFENNAFAYLYATEPGNSNNRVTRVKLDGSGTPPKVILEGIPGAMIHDGGRIVFGPDGKLYITTGDAARSANAQNLQSLGGKILRINSDGSVPSDNPFVGRADVDPRIYTYGHRNVQGLDWNDQGDLIATEFGASSNDELNLIVPGKNYGWPDVQGDRHVSPFTAPLAHSGNAPSWAPSGGTFLKSDRIPEWKGRYFMAMLGFAPGNARGIKMFELDENNRVVGQKDLFRDVYGRIRHVTQGPDGYLYVLTGNTDGRGTPAATDDRLLRIVPLGE